MEAFNVTNEKKRQQKEDESNRKRFKEDEEEKAKQRARVFAFLSPRAILEDNSSRFERLVNDYGLIDDESLSFLEEEQIKALASCLRIAPRAQFLKYAL